MVLNFQLNIWSIWSSFRGTGWVVTFFPSLLLSFSSMWISTFRVIWVQKPEVYLRSFPSVGPTHPGSNWNNHNDGFSDSMTYSHTIISSEPCHNLGGLRWASPPIVPSTTHAWLHCRAGKQAGEVMPYPWKFSTWGKMWKAWSLFQSLSDPHTHTPPINNTTAETLSTPVVKPLPTCSPPFQPL